MDGFDENVDTVHKNVDMVPKSQFFHTTPALIKSTVQSHKQIEVNDWNVRFLLSSLMQGTGFVWISLTTNLANMRFRILEQNFEVESSAQQKQGRDKDTINCPEKLMKISHFNQTFYLQYDRTLLLFSRPMRGKDTSALREMFQYSS